MGWLKNTIAEIEQQQEEMQQGGGEELTHPIKFLLAYLKRTDLSLVPHNYTKEKDGSCKITFTLPPLSEIKKQEAMELAQKQMAGQQAQVQVPQAEPGAEMPAMANSNVKVKIAMTKEDVIKQFPNSFVKAMGL